MNYRHAFHAGNHADVLKHLVLARVLAHLLAKTTPFRAIDVFAGIGLYDLAGDEAGRTGEWEAGVGRLDAPFSDAIEALLAPYRALLAETRALHGPAAYPGSPEIISGMLRAEDRAVFVELHPEDHATLAARFRRDRRVKTLHRDGWTGLNALIPPPERRGLVLIDPPFEAGGEIDRLGASLLKAVAKWPTGIFLAWYPLKDHAGIERLIAALDRDLPRPGLRLDLLIDRPDQPDRLAGSGLVVVNPPWRLAEEAGMFLPALAERLAREAYGAFRCEAIGRAG